MSLFTSLHAQRFTSLLKNQRNLSTSLLVPQGRLRRHLVHPHVLLLKSRLHVLLLRNHLVRQSVHLLWSAQNLLHLLWMLDLLLHPL